MGMLIPVDVNNHAPRNSINLVGTYAQAEAPRRCMYVVVEARPVSPT